jgi:F0F1-type ATP synthase assembly protein I
LQALLGLLAVIAVLPFGSHVVVSVLIGSVTCLISNALMAFLIFKKYSAQRPERVLLRMYGSEAAKLVLISGIFVAAFTTLDGLNVSALLAAYFVTQIASTIIASQIKSRPETRQMPTTRLER